MVDIIPILASGVPDDLTAWFEEHLRPDGAIAADTHILTGASRQLIADFLVRSIPDCYITKENIEAQMAKTGLASSDIIANKLADPGAVMAGDFGEILTLFFLGSGEGANLQKVKKWRFKQDRNKPAPHSDVILLHCPDPSNPAETDYVVCAEAKVKSTPSNTYRPIKAALVGYEQDRVGRLAKTLAWLREKAIETDTAETVKYIERFSKAQIAVTYEKSHRAVAIIDRNFLDAELIQELEVPAQSAAFKVIVIGINDLKALYEECFTRAPQEAKIG